MACRYTHHDRGSLMMRATKNIKQQNGVVNTFLSLPCVQVYLAPPGDVDGLAQILRGERQKR